MQWDLPSGGLTGGGCPGPVSSDGVWLNNSCLSRTQAPGQSWCLTLQSSMLTTTPQALLEIIIGPYKYLL